MPLILYVLQNMLKTCHYIPTMGVGKEMHTLIELCETCKDSTRRYWNYLGDYWPCTGGLSAVNAIGTQLRDPIYSVLSRWRMVVKIYECRHRNREESREQALDSA